MICSIPSFLLCTLLLHESIPLSPVVLLLETGLHISEFCGLTMHIDMQNRILNIDHQLLRDSEIGYYIDTPKTKNGKRELPLAERAYQALQRILKNRGKAQPLIVGGYSNFLFLNREGLPKGQVTEHHTLFIQTYLLYEYGKQRNEP